MTTTLQPTQTPAWQNAILQPAQDFGPVALEVISGAIPAGLRGSLYRNGPARLCRGSDRVGHWFDGDGGILGIHFAQGQATGLYRYVQTAGLQQEEQAGRYQLAGYGMVPPGPWWTRFNKAVKNAANTSVIALDDRVLALWEAGAPHALTLDTLATLGLDPLSSLRDRPFSAHPKRDPHTGDIYNFGVSIGATTQLNLYHLNSRGNFLRTGSIRLEGVPLVHDYAIAGRYLLFCISPVRINPLPVLCRLQSFKDAMAWKPELGTEILVVDRDTLQLVNRTTTEPWFQWHFGNGHEQPDGSVAIAIARYEDFQTNLRLAEIVSGQIRTEAKATLWQLRIAPQSGQVIAMEQLLDRSCEFPVTAPAEVGQASRYTYLSVHRATTDIQTEVFDSIACFDHTTGTLTEANLGDRTYPNEPIYAPDADTPHQGWILTVLFNSPHNCSEVWIFASDRLNAEPVCRLRLPHIIPLGFHGTWKPA